MDAIPAGPTDRTAQTESAVTALAHFYEHLSPDTLSGLDALYAADARFKDPFNEVVGVSNIRRIFEHMFINVDAPRFVVTSRIVQGGQAMLGWDFHLVLRGRPVTVRGVSHLVFDDRGRVCLHRDYWDPAEELYAHLPIVGGLMRLLRRKLSASAPS